MTYDSQRSLNSSVNFYTTRYFSIVGAGDLQIQLTKVSYWYTYQVVKSLVLLYNYIGRGHNLRSYILNLSTQRIYNNYDHVRYIAKSVTCKLSLLISPQNEGWYILLCNIYSLYQLASYGQYGEHTICGDTSSSAGRCSATLSVEIHSWLSLVYLATSNISVEKSIWYWHEWYQSVTASAKPASPMTIPYRKRGKIRWVKLSRLSRVPRNFSHEYKCLSLIILNNEYLCTAYGQATRKYFRENFDGAETANI